MEDDDYKITLKRVSIPSYLEALKAKSVKPNKPPHGKAAIVVEIINMVGSNDNYNFKYWLRTVGNTPVGIILGWLKEIEHADSKYNKGAILTNKFKKRRELLKSLQGTQATLSV